MKEPFLNVGDVIDQTSALNDMELQSYLQGLSANGITTAFATGNISSAITKVEDEKNRQIRSLTSELTGADNNITAAAYYLARTQDYSKLASDVNSMAEKQVSAATTILDLLPRQIEINEWSNENKLDTLFFMQILFITLTFVSVLLFLRSKDIIPPMVFFIVMSITCVTTLFILLSRTRYTNVIRDNRYWHRAHFPAPKK